jgi:hypothetical protein
MHMKKRVLLAVGLCMTCQLSAFAAVTPGELQAAIDKAKVLAPGITVSVASGGGQVAVSTYRNSKANEDDCKIDAVLIAKTVMDLAPEGITSVAVYFFNRKDLSTYDQITLSAGDIRAFGAGELSKEQFLSSLKVEHHEAEGATRVSSFIEASRQRMARRPARATLSGDTVQLEVQMEPWVQSRDVRFEALLIAQKVLEANPAVPIKLVQITFVDPGKQLGDRRVTLSRNDIVTLDQGLMRALSAMNVAKIPARDQILVSEGPGFEERKGLAMRLRRLKFSGADTGAAEKQFAALEQSLKTDSKAQLSTRIDKMDAALQALEEANSAAATSGFQKHRAVSSALTASEIQSQIDKAEILSPGTTMAVAVSGKAVTIATYRNQLANERDCKIDAVLIAKTVMDLAPGAVTSVTIDFFGRVDLSNYEEITLSAGDIKGFGSGVVRKEELLSSVKIELHRTEDSARIANYLQAHQSSAGNQAAQVAFRGESVVVSVEMEPWVADRDVRYEALRIAEKVLEANPGKSIGNIRITFIDPDGQSPDREVSIDPQLLSAQVEPAVSTVLASVSLVEPKPAAAPAAVLEGPLKEQRLAVLKRIEDLKSANVGVGNFVALFQMIEDAAGKGDAAGADGLIKRLNDALDQQEKTMKALKDKESQSAKVASTGNAPVVGAPMETRWAFQREPILESRVVAEPEIYVQELQRKYPNWQTDPNFWHAMRFFAQALRRGGEPDEAAKFDQRVYDMKRQHPEFK